MAKKVLTKTEARKLAERKTRHLEHEVRVGHTTFDTASTLLAGFLDALTQAGLCELKVFDLLDEFNERNEDAFATEMGCTRW